MKSGGLGPGAQTRYARALGVHPSTISRDLDILIARCNGGGTRGNSAA
jgi:hypothetical protein